DRGNEGAGALDVRALERRHVHEAHLVGAGHVDRQRRPVQAACEHGSVVQLTAHELRARTLEVLRDGRGAHEAPQPVPPLTQEPRDPAADEPRRAREERDGLGPRPSGREVLAHRRRLAVSAEPSRLPLPQPAGSAVQPIRTASPSAAETSTSISRRRSSRSARARPLVAPMPWMRTTRSEPSGPIRRSERPGRRSAIVGSPSVTRRRSMYPRSGTGTTSETRKRATPLMEAFVDIDRNSERFGHHTAQPRGRGQGTRRSAARQRPPPWFTPTPLTCAPGRRTLWLSVTPPNAGTGLRLRG